MLNLHQHIINNYLYNEIREELDDRWLKHLLPESRTSLIQGYYNAGIIVVNLSDFNIDNYYDIVIKKDFEKYCGDLYSHLKPILEITLKRMFEGFNSSLTKYDIVLFMEGAAEDELVPVTC